MMKSIPEYLKRRRAYDDDAFQWHFGRIPEDPIKKEEDLSNEEKKELELLKEINKKEKAAYLEQLKKEGPKDYIYSPHTSTVFLVHGIGMQSQSETAAQLRSGFEDALRKISQWQDKKGMAGITKPGDLPQPMIQEGFWANYANIKETFKEDYDSFSGNEKKFFKKLWKFRLSSTFRTFGWFVGKQLSLLSPSVICRVGLLPWLMYWPLQIYIFAALSYALISHPKIISGFITDVRLYLEPKGMVERAIVQRIDYKVGKEFLKLIGLDWDFKFLHGKNKKHVAGKQTDFNRIVWVAHSLGTIISYNVLSDLFNRAQKIEKDENGKYTVEQLRAVHHFKICLRRFITLGSPLDKVAFLFGEKSLRVWPDCPRSELLGGGEDWRRRYDKDNPTEKYKNTHKNEWWFNFYHAFDPVSGPLNSTLLFKDDPPENRHIKPFYLPGLVHVKYWKDSRTLKYILSRTFGRYLWFENCVRRPLLSGIMIFVAVFCSVSLVVFSLLLLRYYWWDIISYLTVAKDWISVISKWLGKVITLPWS